MYSKNMFKTIVAFVKRPVSERCREREMVNSRRTYVRGGEKSLGILSSIFVD